MSTSYDKSTMTLAAATAQNLVDLLTAEGYTGSFLGKFLELEDVNSLGDVYHGNSSAVNASNGRLLTTYSRSATALGLPVDPNGDWLWSTGGGDISCTFESY